MYVFHWSWALLVRDDRVYKFVTNFQKSIIGGPWVMLLNFYLSQEREWRGKERGREGWEGEQK